MEFSKFASLLQPLLRRGLSNGDFARELFLEISSFGDEENNPLYKVSADSYRKQYRGTRGISGPASLALSALNKEKFANWIDDFGPDTCGLLAQVLAPYDDAVTPVNVGERCASMFVDILKSEAQQHRGARPAKAKDGQNGDDDRFAVLALEAGGRCPLCGKPLLKRKSGKNVPAGKVVSLLQPEVMLDYRIKREYEQSVDAPPKPGTDEGRIALCSKCAEAYEDNHSKEEYSKLVQLKRRLATQRETEVAISELDLADEAADLLLRLANKLDYNGEMGLRYDALRVARKMNEPNSMFSREIEGFAVQYYNAIRQQASDMQSNGFINFDKIAEQIKLCYIELSEQFESQEDIFQQLCNWIQTKSGVTSQVACRALVAFFVQDCEVFDEITQ